MSAVFRLLSIGLTLVALWCASGASAFGPSVAAAGAAAASPNVPAAQAEAHHGHAMHMAPAGGAPHGPSADHFHGDCAMTASHCAAMAPPVLALLGTLVSGQVVHDRLVAAPVRSRAPVADPPPSRA